jgi:hypothetical protein
MMMPRHPSEVRRIGEFTEGYFILKPFVGNWRRNARSKDVTALQPRL